MQSIHILYFTIKSLPKSITYQTHKFYTYLFFLINKPHHAIRYNLINDNLKIRAFFDLLQVQLAYIFDLVRGGSSSSLSCTTLFSFKFFMSVLNKNHNHFKLDHINILLLVLLSLFFVTKQLDVSYKITSQIFIPIISKFLHLRTMSEMTLHFIWLCLLVSLVSLVFSCYKIGISYAHAYVLIKVPCIPQNPYVYLYSLTLL